MTKKAIFIRKLRRIYKEKDKWDYSEFYPKGAYFGYASWDEFKRKRLAEFRQFYGKGLKKLPLEIL